MKNIYIGKNIQGTSISIYKNDDKYIGALNKQNNHPEIIEFDNKKEVDKYLSDKNYTIECANCGKQMFIQSATIHSVQFLSGELADICEECWSKYTVDLEYTANVFMESKLLKDKIKKALKRPNSLQRIKAIVYSKLHVKR